MVKRRIIGIFCAAALIMGLVPAQAFAADPIVTDVVIHKVQAEQSFGAAQNHDGELLTTEERATMGITQNLPGIIFRYWKVATSATAAQMNALKAIQTIEGANAYAAANPTVLTAQTDTAPTDANGEVRLSNMPEGIYFFAELNGASHNVSGYVGVPFLMELPAMRTDGSAYFGTGANALHVYPKNILKIPGLDLRTIAYGEGVLQENEVLVSGSVFDVYKKNSAGVYVLETAAFSVGSGHVTFTEPLGAGDYYLELTATHANYLVDNRPVYFNVSAGVVTHPTSAELPGAAVQNDRSHFHAENTLALESNPLITLALTSEPTVVKEPQDSAGNPKTSFNIGDTVTWKATLDVPSDIAQFASFGLFDEMDAGMSWAPAATANLKVSAGSTVLASPTHYSATISGQTLTVNFAIANIGSYAGQQLTITYDTKINANVTMGAQIGNSAEPIWDNNRGDIRVPGDAPDPERKTVWTGGYKWIKRAGSSTGAALAGAEFQITTDAAGTSPLVWTQDLIDANGANFVTPVVGSPIVMVSGADGSFEIKGLAGVERDATTGNPLPGTGTYYLKETKAPTDSNGVTYNLLRDTVEFVITETSYYVDPSALTPVGQDPTAVVNNAGLEIPMTGGIGTVIFTIIGLGLMGFGIFLFRKKKSAQVSENL